jgi:hypothetical protein
MVDAGECSDALIVSYNNDETTTVTRPLLLISPSNRVMVQLSTCKRLRPELPKVEMHARFDETGKLPFDFESVVTYAGPQNALGALSRASAADASSAAPSAGTSSALLFPPLTTAASIAHGSSPSLAMRTFSSTSSTLTSMRWTLLRATMTA